MKARSATTANERLRRERELRGWSQKRVADALGTNKFMISRWEGGVMLPSPHFREQLCLLFGKTAEELGFISPVTGGEESAEMPLFWHLPLRRNPFFTGRAGILQELDALLRVSPATALTPSYALHGLGGIGKTQIVVEYAYQHALEYVAIFWIEAESVETIVASFHAIADVLQLPHPRKGDQRQAIAAVQRWLVRHTGWLLIWDNLADLELFQHFLPSTRHGANLLTTCNQAVGTLAQGIEVQTMEPEEGLLLLLRRAKVLSPNVESEQVSQFAGRSPTDYAAAQTLVTAMGGLPLALDQAGAYIEETGCSVSDYLQRYTTGRAQLLERRGLLAGDHPASMTATFRQASQRLEQDHPVAADLLRVCALLDAEAIPEELFTMDALYPGRVLEPLAVDPSQLDLAIVALRTLSLLQRHPETHMFSIHPLVQAVLQDEMSEPERRQWQQRAVRMLNALFPEAVPEAWQRCERFLPHVLTCAVSMPTQAEDQDLAEVLRKAADYLRERTRYEQAKPLYQRALRFWEQTLGPQCPEVATVLKELARLSYEEGKYMQAESLLRRACTIFEQHLGQTHPETIKAKNDYQALNCLILDRCKQSS